MFRGSEPSRRARDCVRGSRVHHDFNIFNVFLSGKMKLLPRFVPLSTLPSQKRRASAVQQPCNSHATAVQQSCNSRASAVQQLCNSRASAVQQSCNSCATVVQQPCNSWELCSARARTTLAANNSRVVTFSPKLSLKTLNVFSSNNLELRRRTQKVVLRKSVRYSQEEK